MKVTVKFIVIMAVLTLFLISCSGNGSDTKSRDLPGNTVLKIDNPTDFLMNIKSGNTVVLADGTYYIEDLYEGWKKSSGVKNENLFWVDVHDGVEITVKGLKKFKLCAENPGKVNIVSKASYSYVMTFETSQDVIIDGIVFGHETQSECSGGVLAFKNCSKISISRCDLYGSGTEGLLLEGTEFLNIMNSKIRECSYDFMTVEYSKNITIKDVEFFDNILFEFYDFIIVENSSNILFDGTTMIDNGKAIYADNPHNKMSLFNVQSSEGVLLKNSVIRDNNLEFFANREGVVIIGSGNTIDKSQFKKGMYESD